MSNDRSTSPISVPQSSSRPRRASLASGLGFSDYASKPGTQGQSSGAPTGPIPQANPGRRLSITTLGLSGSPTQTSPFGGRSFRHGSISSSIGSSSANIDEAVAEDGESAPPSANSPFARRLSFGAQALRDVRGGSVGNGEGFNWTEALRSRAERAPSFGTISPNAPPGHNQAAMSPAGHHQRAASIASMEQPSREMPKQPKQNKPDFFQEKILRGDFMD
ncbi:hypothetical protein BDV59DRAFT_69054 [Aspergillus ambiguus]|uniref:uncharacterized protein n=1 Tax=Aspergillus ambiguus TaxID=176160 RepID=UPI003CCE08FE